MLWFHMQPYTVYACSACGSQLGDLGSTGGEGVSSSSPSEEGATLSSSLTYCVTRRVVVTNVYLTHTHTTQHNTTYTCEGKRREAENNVQHCSIIVLFFLLPSHCSLTQSVYTHGCMGAVAMFHPMPLEIVCNNTQHLPTCRQLACRYVDC